ncbi:hypothetical protein GGD61_001683 [Bradyrhizobium sp. SBR1B]|nr:hypothetical protein [Bradyrhizobium sp. SBR1B]
MIVRKGRRLCSNACLRPGPIQRKASCRRPCAEVSPILPAKWQPEKEQCRSAIEGHHVVGREVRLAAQLGKPFPELRPLSTGAKLRCPWASRARLREGYSLKNRSRPVKTAEASGAIVKRSAHAASNACGLDSAHFAEAAAIALGHHWKRDAANAVVRSSLITPMSLQRFNQVRRIRFLIHAIAVSMAQSV